MLEQKVVVVQAAEKWLGDPLVAALGDPGRARVAAAHVIADCRVPAPLRDAIVDEPHVACQTRFRVLAVGDDFGPHAFGDEVGDERIVDLDVAAAGGSEIRDFGAVCPHGIGEERFDVGIHTASRQRFGRRENASPDGEGMVIFAVRSVASARNAKSRTRIGSGRRNGATVTTFLGT